MLTTHNNRQMLEARNQHITNANGYIKRAQSELAEAEAITTRRADKLVTSANLYSIKLMELLNNIITLSTTGYTTQRIIEADNASRHSTDLTHSRRRRGSEQGSC